MRYASLGFLAIILCSGQMCGVSSAPTLPGESDPPPLENGIPEGVYMGQVTRVSRFISAANLYQPEEIRNVDSYSAWFGPAGAPLGSDGSSVQLGYTFGEMTESGGITSTVTDVYLLGASGVVPRSATIFSNVTMKLGDKTMTGYRREDFTLIGQGQVSYHSEMELAGEGDYYEFLTDGLLWQQP